MITRQLRVSQSHKSKRSFNMALPRFFELGLEVGQLLVKVEDHSSKQGCVFSGRYWTTDSLLHQGDGLRISSYALFCCWARIFLMGEKGQACCLQTCGQNSIRTCGDVEWLKNVVGFRALEHIVCEECSFSSILERYCDILIEIRCWLMLGCLLPDAVGLVSNS